jgi:DNA-binding MarR family transcriptional regulator
VREALAPHDLTHVQFVLLASLWWLADHGGPPSQSGIAEHAGTDAMMTSQVLRKLEARGLIAREEDPDDARARRVRLTPEGAELLSGALRDVERADAEFFAPAAEHQSTLLELLARLSG